MSDIVRLNEEGALQFPRYARRIGRIIGTTKDGLQRVRFDGIRTPIEFHTSFLTGTNAPDCYRSRNELTDRISARRRMLKRALEIVRHDPIKRETFLALAKGLGGSRPISDSLMDEASNILAGTGASSDIELITPGMDAHQNLEGHDAMFQPRQ